MAKKAQGFVFVEMIIFIVVVGIVAVGVLKGINEVLIQSIKPQKITTASFLANARMQLILLQRVENGFTSLTDPCTSGSPAACTALASFATANGYSVISTINNAGSYTTITTRASGSNLAYNYMVVSNYNAT